MRAVGIIIENDKILLIRRFKNGLEYYVFPGGSVEDNETVEDALEREMREELSLKIKIRKKLLEIENRGQREVYYLIKRLRGKPKIGGPEKERMNKQNQYHLSWVKLEKIKELANLYPQEAMRKLYSHLRNMSINEFLRKKVSFRKLLYSLPEYKTVIVNHSTIAIMIIGSTLSKRFIAGWSDLDMLLLATEVTSKYLGHVAILKKKLSDLARTKTGIEVVDYNQLHLATKNPALALAFFKYIKNFHRSNENKCIIFIQKGGLKKLISCYLYAKNKFFV